MPVTRRETITQAQMDALADLANSKDIAGKPYEFSEDGGWKDELERLRENIIDDVDGLGVYQIGYPAPALDGYPSRTFVSGPWPVIYNGGGGTSVLNVTSHGFPQTETNKETRYQRVNQYSDAVYYFPEQGKASITTELILAGNYGRYAAEKWDGNGDTEASYSFRLETNGMSGAFSGQLMVAFSGFPTLQAHHYEVFGNITGDITADGSSVRLTAAMANVGSGVYTWGVRRLAGAPAFSSGGLIPQGSFLTPFKWSIQNSTPEEVSGIHSTKKVYKITPPPLSEIGVFPPASEGLFPIIEETPGIFQPAVIWMGNQAAIRHTVSAGIASIGLWVAKTLPITEIIDAGISTPAASQPTTSESTIEPISKACEPMLRRFHWQRDTDGLTAVSSSEVSLGSVIREVYVGRKPVDPEEEGGYWLPDTTSDLAVKLGCIRNGAFVEFETVTIPAGEYGNRIETFWPVFSLHQLCYQCSEAVDVQALAISPMERSPSGTLLDVGSAVEFPILADHYNDTEALLDLV